MSLNITRHYDGALCMSYYHNRDKHRWSIGQWQSKGPKTRKKAIEESRHRLQMKVVLLKLGVV